jgi:transcriptional regulator with XRE-family HTH domain
MSRFEQRKKRRLQDPEFRAAYLAADAELQLVEALDMIRHSLGLTQVDVASRVGKSQAAVSQFFGADSGISLDRLVEYLSALKIHARIELVPQNGDDKVVTVRTHTSLAKRPLPVQAHMEEPEKMAVSPRAILEVDRRQTVAVDSEAGKLRARRRHLVAVA